MEDYLLVDWPKTKRRIKHMLMGNYKLIDIAKYFNIEAKSFYSLLGNESSMSLDYLYPISILLDKTLDELLIFKGSMDTSKELDVLLTEKKYNSIETHFIISSYCHNKRFIKNLPDFFLCLPLISPYLLADIMSRAAGNSAKNGPYILDVINRTWELIEESEDKKYVYNYKHFYMDWPGIYEIPAENELSIEKEKYKEYEASGFDTHDETRRYRNLVNEYVRKLRECD